LKILDTIFLLDLLIGDEGARKKAEEIDEDFHSVTTAVNVFELVDALFNNYYLTYDTMNKTYEDLQKLLARVEVLPLDTKSINARPKFEVPLGKEDMLIPSMIASIAKAYSCDTIITRNPERFENISGLKTEEY